MIVAWGIFIVSLLQILVWSTDFIPALSNCNKHDHRCLRSSVANLGIWFIFALFSAQYIWG